MAVQDLTWDELKANVSANFTNLQSYTMDKVQKCKFCMARKNTENITVESI